MHPLASVRNSLILAGAALCVVPLAEAQVTLNLTTVEQTSCVAVTDALGLQLVPGGTDLQATGVTLTGTGCGSANSEFDVTVNAPATAVAGTPFNVSWSATEAATKCTYGGSAGITGWPVGQTACDGAACAGTHNPSVTLPAAGSYSFSMTCTNATGFAQDGLTASGPPEAPQPPNFVLTAPATATTGTAIQVSWSVQGAAACTGSASLNGSSASLAGWTDVTSPTSPRSVTFAQAGAWVLNLSCSNANGSTASQPRAITVSPVGDPSCPAGRQTVADVCYSYSLGSSCANGTDVTKFENIWGRMAPQQTPTPFPGEQFFAIFKNMQQAGYISAKFTVPATGLPPLQWGMFSHGESLSGPNVTMAISPQCGDFQPATSICLRSNMGPGDILTKWRLPTAAGIVAACDVVPGQSYYVNIKMTEPVPPTHDHCAGSTCKVTIQHNHTP